MTWWLWVRSPVEATFLSSIFFFCLSTLPKHVRKEVGGFGKKIVLVLVWDSHETYARHWPPWYDFGCWSGIKPQYNQASFSGAGEGGGVRHHFSARTLLLASCLYWYFWLIQMENIYYENSFLAPLAVGQRAYVMVRCASVRESVLTSPTLWG